MDKKVLDKLKQAKKRLKEEFGIEEIAVFGSFARGEEKKQSDIDIAIIKMKRKNGLIIANAKRYLSDYLKKDVDLGLYDSIHPFIKDVIKEDLIYV